MSERKSPVCSHCLECGHTKASPSCPLKGLEAAPRPDKEISNIRWTPEKEALLICRVKGGPLKPDWEKIAEHIGHPAGGCKSRYDELVSIDQQLEDSCRKISITNIIDTLSEKRTQCDTCKDVFYIPLYEWRGVVECPRCHKAHDTEQASLWKSLDTHLTCIFCNRTRDDGVPLNFDHMNMFEKGDSICLMVRRGDTLEKILAEVSKCQVLCKSCHALVTAVENMVGFRRVKTNLTRSINGTLKEGEPPTPEMILEDKEKYSGIYNKTIEKLYPMMKQLVSQNKPM